MEDFKSDRGPQIKLFVEVERGQKMMGSAALESYLKYLTNI